MDLNEIKILIEKEERRQQETLSLIASENYASKDVLLAQGSMLTNKYVEGYPSRRYYGGCEVVDEIERIAINEAKSLFSAEHANVQPHSGSQANEAAYMALLPKGSKILAMSLESGGHLTHGHAKNFSSRYYDFIHYKVNSKTELIDYDMIEKLVKENRPNLLLAGASSYSRKIDFKKLALIAKDNNCLLMVDMAHIAGLVAAGIHQSPIPYADVVTSTTHKTLRGARGGLILCKKEHKKAIDSAVFPGSQGGALMHAIAGKAISFIEAGRPEYIEYQKQVVFCSKEFAKSFKKTRVVSGGTDNHQFTLDVYKSFGLTGKDAEAMLSKAGVVVNKNVIPYDTLAPNISSGIRIGTPAAVTRGVQAKEFVLLGEKMEKLFMERSDKNFNNLSELVKKLCTNHPIK